MANLATCVDCASNPSSHTIRRRPLCSPCLQRFVSSKVLKRMESFRPQNQKSKSASTKKPRLLVPLSGWISSLTLLAVLVAQIRRQMEKTGRTAYEILGMHASIDDGRNVDVWWEKLKLEFPECEFISPISLSMVFRRDKTIESDLALIGMERSPDEADDAFMTRMFASARSATARTELKEIMLKRLVAATARENDCESVLWGHSDSKLAATTLSLVAKGRGTAVSTELADGSILWDTAFNYPLRDLFTPELDMYLQCTSEGVRTCVLGGAGDVDVPMSLKATSIDALLSTYITGQGEKYPSIMANVVRTAGKLQAPEIPENERCKICAGHITDTLGQDQSLCYGCKRMMQDIKP